MSNFYKISSYLWNKVEIKKARFILYVVLTSLTVSFSHFAFGQAKIYRSNRIEAANVEQVISTDTIESVDTHGVERVMGTPNNNCTTPTLLTVGAPCVAVSNIGNSFFGPQPSCYGGQTANQWFIFKATAPNNFIRLTGTIGRCFSGLAVYGPYLSANPGCPLAGQQIFCVKPAFKINDVASLVFTVGDYYMIQVSDVFGGPCGANGGSWCISVMNPVTCTSCASPCGPISVYTALPASWAVENPKYAQDPVDPASVVSPTYCYTFNANNTSDNVDMGSFTEGAAGFISFVWTVYNPLCVAVSNGNLGGNMTASPLVCGNPYVLCISFEPAGQIDSVSPYLYNTACVLLPIKLTNFSAEYFTDDHSVHLQWTTATETNNKLFTIEKSADGDNWQAVVTVSSSAINGNSTEPLNYSATDAKPYTGVSFYRLKQTDYDGNFSYSATVSLNIPADYSMNLFPNPANLSITLRYASLGNDPVQVKITDMYGKTVASYSYNQVQKGVNNYEISTASLPSGMYFVELSNPVKTLYQKFVKQ